MSGTYTIILIGSREEDFDDYYRIRCDESDIYWMGHKSAPEYQMLKKCFMERLHSNAFSSCGDKRIYMIRLKNSDLDLAIGQLLLTIQEEGVEIGISIVTDYQGKGYGSIVIKQAVDIAKEYSEKVFACIRDDNVASQKCFLNNGFKRTEEYEIINYPIAGLIKFRKYVLV